ncbi:MULTISPECIES: serine/threonine-protein kinase [unclassified Microcystis]|jgi:serine/threonine protein kinase|uniref:non-specific serine/threonine protein kinase n=1 Tax=Microcystis flos-aquae Mf_QC_C_20070823_S10D TaxID=2486236 RepID=A0A552KM50_9CHRO|nr:MULTISPECIES: serine/threonine-protein kinase [unclassified Microcystis]MCA2815203.1 serine/threonine protein kinase [Microcystis sp. M085S1]MCA2854901.1 serine/threonine protein kinase [Microcystis sp. M065S1]TRT81566.1 MAG: serine/threonine protein kinase [Microcystis flos-aquae Ma_QC_C_20070823_S18]TRT97336.1 MAG: serine/threonine protein kinase [Microcystis flos-aquae Ma_QC_C_20070823_S18D]TRV09047.1 MAG: serine/threonine protein kinase [Microcystis flos-aquae Mf_QC_C_20070823_S10D]TRV
MKPSMIIGQYYKIVKKLGVGGFGETYIAEDSRRLGSQCVIKKLIFKSNNQDELKKAQELFYREAKTLMNLGKHDQIPYLIAYFSEDQEFYLVQEYIEGDSLEDEISSRGKFEEQEVIEFLLGILPVLEYIHKKQVIHRDIKPSNILRRDRDKKFILIDFGGVKAPLLSSSQLPNLSGGNLTKIFTSGYTPKEQMDGYPEFNSDIYALGMTVIKALTGIEPKDISRNSSTKMLAWRTKANNVGDQLAAIIDKMIQENHIDRYKNVEEILEDLHHLGKTVVITKSRVSVLRSVINTQIPMVNIPLGKFLMILVMITGFIWGFNLLRARVFDSHPDPKPMESPIPNPSPSPSSPDPENEGGIFLRPDNLKKN